jgi:hypothetical protein
LSKSVELEAVLPVTEATTSTYRDHRMGYAFNTPNGWVRGDVTPAALAGSGSLTRWDMKGRWISILACVLPVDAAHQVWLMSYLEQLLRDEIADVTRATATREQTEFAGQTATHVAWHAPLQRVDAFLLHHEGVGYAVVTMDRGDEARRHVTEAFALLP